MNISEIINKVVCGYLNEESFYNISVDSILSDNGIKSIIDSDPDGFQGLLDYYIEVNNLDDTNPKKIRNSSEFQSFVYQYLYNDTEEIFYTIDDCIHNGKIKLYRLITVGDNWLNHLSTQGKRLGIYWTFDKEKAEAYWADSSKSNTALIEIEINEKYVDWDVTFKQLTSPSYSEEKEIRLFKNTPINILSLEINDEPVDISIIKNKTFYA